MNKIEASISVEQLVENYPLSVSFLREFNIICVLCGEPVWGSLKELMESKGFTEEQQHQIVDELNKRLSL